MRFICALTLVASLATVTVFAQGATVRISQEIDSDGHLVDSYGRSLYLNMDDEEGRSTCYNDCAANWPPLLVRGALEAGDGLSESSLDTTERENGTTQLRYGGWPLYYYAEDAFAGDYLGQGVNDQWYLVSAMGEPLTELASPEARGGEAAESAAASKRAAESGDVDEQPSAEAVDAELYEQGRLNFANVCAACHGQNGRGGQGPVLVGNARLADAQHVADVIVNGFGYMPAVGSNRSDEWVAAVATYVRNSWDNDFGPVDPEEVEAVR